MSSIDFYLYYGGEPCSDVTYGVTYEGPGKKLEIIQLKKRREINLKKLKKKIMKELDLDRRLHDIKIIYRAPHAVFNDRIFFMPIEIKGDKHVQIMFDRINSTPQLKAAELYISVESRIEVAGEDVQRTTLEVGGGEEFHPLHMDSYPLHTDNCLTLTPCTTVGGYTPPCQETQTPMEVCGSSYQQECVQSLGREDEDEDEDEDDVDHGRDEYEEMIGRDDFHENTINYENVDNVVDDHDDNAMEFQDDIGDGIGVQPAVPTYEAHGPSFHANTWDNIVDPSNVEIPLSSSWVRGMNFSKGLIFPNKEAVRQALIVYSMDNNKNYITEWSNQQRLCVKCVNESCAWKVRAFSQRKLNGLWAVTVYGGPHTCPSVGVNKDGRMMDSNFLAKELHTYILADHTSKIKDLQNLMKERFNHDISYYKIWDAKQKAIANIHGNWEESYQKLQKLLLAYKDSDPGTHVSFRSINGNIPDTIIFKYVFWAFAPSIAGFAHCRPVISIDGTHLYGKYKGKLLIAMATDANNEIFPLAFAVVDDETGASWGWFLSCLRTAIRDVVPESGICIISDRHRGIISSIAQWPNDYVPVYHRYCIRHVASNFNTQFNDKFLKSLALKAGYEHQDRKLGKILDCLKEAELKFSQDPNPNIARKKPYSYLMKEGLKMWTLSHDGGRRYGAMTTNMSECFNGVLKGARGLPISALVDYIWCKLVAYFNDRRTKILGDIEHGQKFSKHAMEKYEANYEKGTRHYVRPFNQQDGVFQVCTTHNPHRSDGGDHSHEVRLLENTCTCGKWEIYKIPCSHVIAVCIRERINAMRYIDPCYTLQQRLATYSHGFRVPKDKSLWREVAGPKLYPDPEMLRDKGRPMSTRIRNEMDWRESQPKPKCGVCHEEGHNRRRCPTVIRASTSSNVPN